MAYETGSANSAPDLLDKFALFAAAQGWTVNRNVVAGSGREVCISKGAAYFNLRAYHNESAVLNGSTSNNRYGISVNGSDGYDAGAAWDRQPGYPQRGSTTGGDQGHAMMPLVINYGPFPAHHFFAPDDKTLYCELEAAAGQFVRFGCGSLDLFNASAPGGGRFFYATGGVHPSASVGTNTWLGADQDSANYGLEMVPFRAADYMSSMNGLQGSMVRAAFGSFDNWANAGRTTSITYQGMVCQGGGCHDKVLRDYSPNALNGIGLLLPNIVSLNVGDEYLSPIGVVPGIRYMDMSNYLPGDEFSLGGDTWKVFPWYQKDGLSLGRGIAYLKVT